jgi:hypothetical protein
MAIDILTVNLPREPNPSRVSKDALWAMTAIVVTILLISIYTNVQKLRRDKIEKATFNPAPATSATP